MQRVGERGRDERKHNFGYWSALPTHTYNRPWCSVTLYNHPGGAGDMMRFPRIPRIAISLPHTGFFRSATERDENTSLALLPSTRLYGGFVPRRQTVYCACPLLLLYDSIREFYIMRLQFAPKSLFSLQTLIFRCTT